MSPMPSEAKAAGSTRRDDRRDPVEIVRGLTVPPRNPQGTREGFTTGASAAAAAQAACCLLERDERPEVVAVPSPLGFDLMIPINRLAYDRGIATAGVIKDGGDDPDVTHGAEVLASVRRVEEPGIHIRGGAGVGTITQPGLELPPGSPAINPVPRLMIAQGVAIALGTESPSPGVEVTVSIPRGEALARKTLNARIGIVGGLSILGTTGIVRPMSTASWRASVVQSIDVAAANSVRHIVLTTGGRSERFAVSLYPDLPEMAFVQMGIFTGESLKRARERGVPKVSVCGMIGKVAKLATGQMQTHVAGGGVDVAFLAGLARDAGAPDELVATIAAANTGRHVEELIDAAGFAPFYAHVAARAAQACNAHVAGGLEVEVVLFDFDGKVLARVAAPRVEAAS
jgi:cobalt-precorrin-5B (C1)-methyltransferase